VNTSETALNRLASSLSKQHRVARLDMPQVRVFNGKLTHAIKSLKHRVVKAGTFKLLKRRRLYPTSTGRDQDKSYEAHRLLKKKRRTFYQ